MEIYYVGVASYRNKAEFQDLSNLIPQLSRQPPQMETNRYCTAHVVTSTGLNVTIHGRL